MCNKDYETSINNKNESAQAVVIRKWKYSTKTDSIINIISIILKQEGPGFNPQSERANLSVWSLGLNYSLQI